MDLLQIIKDNRRCLNITGIEEVYEIPRGILMSAVNGDRKLPDKYFNSLGRFFENLGIECVVVESNSVVNDVLVKDIVSASKKENKFDKDIPAGYEEMTSKWKLLFSGKYSDGERKVDAIKIGDKMYVPK